MSFMRYESVSENVRSHVLYELLFPLRKIYGLGWLNVLRYVPFRVIAATVSAMLISFFVPENQL